MEEIKANTNQTRQRDYDKDPIIIKNFSVLFESYLVLIIAIFGDHLKFRVNINSDRRNPITPELKF